MHVIKMTLIAVAATFAWSAAAEAITVKKRIEAPGLPDEVWAITGEGFCKIKDWHPAVAECEEVTEGSDTYRLLTLKDGGKIKEKLTGKDDMSYSYEIVESPLPVKNYTAKFWVEDSDRANRTVIHWDAEFDASGASDEEAAKTIGGIFTAGLKGIKQMALPPDEDNPGNEDRD